MDRGWELFRGPDIASLEGGYDPENPRSAQSFTDNFNFWSVVTDLSLDDVGTPFLISRNLDEKALIPAGESDERPRISDKVVDRDYVIVVRIGGSSEIIAKKDLSWKKLNPSGATNRILHPGDP